MTNGAAEDTYSGVMTIGTSEPALWCSRKPASMIAIFMLPPAARCQATVEPVHRLCAAATPGFTG